jgi:hypothetical protein
MTEVVLVTDLLSKLDVMRDTIKSTSEQTDRNLGGVIDNLHAAQAVRDARINAARETFDTEVAEAERQFEDVLSEQIVVLTTVRKGFVPTPSVRLVKSA